MGGSGSVEVRSNSIRLIFYLHGKRYAERLTVNGESLPPTPANLKYANRIANEVKKAIAKGNFEFPDYFPDSKHVVQTTPDSFGKLAAVWLESKRSLAAATKDQYKNAVAFWVSVLGDVPITSLSYQVLAHKIGSYPWASARSANNYLIPLRGIMGFHFSGRRAAENPMIGIKNLKRVKKLPDPLTTNERDSILTDMRSKYDERVAAYFQFAFYTGLRPEEMIALHWADIDFKHKSCRISRVKTFRGQEREGSKTHSERDVHLVAAAMEALTLMKPYTYMKSEYVFEHPQLGTPWHDERSQRDTYWKPTLKRLGIRYRRAYATRHTFATAALMAGVNPAYVAKQLGHTNAKLLFETYSKWIDGADKHQERDRMEAAFGAIYSQNLPKKSSDA
jgi:integrase